MIYSIAAGFTLGTIISLSASSYPYAVIWGSFYRPHVEYKEKIVNVMPHDGVPMHIKLNYFTDLAISHVKFFFQIWPALTYEKNLQRDIKQNEETMKNIEAQIQLKTQPASTDESGSEQSEDGLKKITFEEYEHYLESLVQQGLLKIEGETRDQEARRIQRIKDWETEQRKKASNFQITYK